MGAGQFCTNPGVVVIPAGEATDRFAEIARTALTEVPAQTMLTDGIAEAYRNGQARVAETGGVQEVLTSICDQRNTAPFLYRTSASTWLANETLAEEVFGPLGIIVTAETSDEMRDVARSLHGQLTCTLQMDEADMDMARSLLPILERNPGACCQWLPTGVEVCDSMVHGGPLPGFDQFRATSVGTLSIRRFLRLFAIRTCRMPCCRNDSRRASGERPLADTVRAISTAEAGGCIEANRQPLPERSWFILSVSAPA